MTAETEIVPVARSKTARMRTERPPAKSGLAPAASAWAMAWSTVSWMVWAKRSDGLGGGDDVSKEYSGCLVWDY